MKKIGEKLMKVLKKSLSILLAFLMLAGTAAVCGSVAFAESGSYSAGDIIEYGTYPQSRVESTDALNAAAESATWKSYGYYSGSGVYYDGNMAAADYAEFADFVLDGVKYRVVRFSDFRPYLTGLTRTEASSYVDDNGYSLNTVYFFRYEPVQWKVLDPATGFVVSAKHIDSQAFSNYLGKSGAEMLGADGYSANDYSHSSIKPWLNDDFYNTAFTESQKNNIKADSDLGGVYLLSTEETADYTMPDFTGTDYAKCQGLHSYSRGGCYRWTRTATAVSEFPYSISDSDVLATGDSANYTSFGICPAMRLKELKADTTVSCSAFSSGGVIHTPGECTYVDENSHKYTCLGCGDEITESHNWSYPKWDWTNPEKPSYSSACPGCGKAISGDAERVEIDAHEATVDTYAYTNYTAWITLSGKACNGTYCLIYSGSLLAARKAAFEEYKAEKVSEAGALALETDGALCTEAIENAKAAINALVYDEEKSLDENKAAVEPVIVKLCEDLTELRKIYFAVFVADGNTVARIPYTVETQSIETPAVPAKEGFNGAWEAFTLTPGGITVNAVYTPGDPDTPPSPGITGADIIKGNPANKQKTYNYKTTVTFTAIVPEGSSVQWYINGNKAGTDSTLTVKESTGGYEVKVIATGSDGKQTMDEEKVTIKNGFFDKLIWFFVHLFNPGAYIIEQ